MLLKVWRYFLNIIHVRLLEVSQSSYSILIGVGSCGRGLLVPATVEMWWWGHYVLICTLIGSVIGQCLFSRESIVRLKSDILPPFWAGQGRARVRLYSLKRELVQTDTHMKKSENACSFNGNFKVPFSLLSPFICQ
jgi:hypothetical protein